MKEDIRNPLSLLAHNLLPLRGISIRSFNSYWEIELLLKQASPNPA